MVECPRCRDQLGSWPPNRHHDRTAEAAESRESRTAAFWRNQSLGANTTTSIAGGAVKAKSSDGKSFGGYCKDGDEAKVVEKDGVVMMVPGH